MVAAAPVIDVSALHLLLAMAPLIAIAWIAWRLGLDIESPILVGTARTFVQLTILSFILDPIFVRGVDLWWLVVAYTLFMVLLAAFESSARSKYYFPAMFWYVLGSLLFNVVLVSLFAFAIIIQPTPMWDPHYVIPIVGMLLGNCINGISLSLNALLTSMVESSREVELLLSFGANSYEASARLLREAIRTGTMPQLNSMAITGIISIPGMMTGQILGGSTVTEAARYQILIMYLIAACAFGTTLTQVYFTLHVCFDSKIMLRIDRLHKRADKLSFLSMVRQCWGSLRQFFTKTRKQRLSSSSSIPMEETYFAPKGDLTVTTLRSGEGSTLTADGLAYSFERAVDDEGLMAGEDATEKEFVGKRLLFQNVSFQLATGGTALVDGPSGVGKSTLLRILAGLTPPDEGEVFLSGQNKSGYEDMTAWRKQILYVPQTKVEIPGTPTDLLKKISNFQIWKGESTATPSYQEIRFVLRELIKEWDMNTSALDSEWKMLSGGESQRMLLAVALATRPKVIMLDESTSAMDWDTKVKVETSVKDYCAQQSMCAIWITHDQSQKDRIRAHSMDSK